MWGFLWTQRNWTNYSHHPDINQHNGSIAHHFPIKTSYLSIYLPIYLSTYLSIYLSISLYIYMYVCMYVYMYIWLCPCIGEIPIAMCHSCRVQQHPIAEVARRPWSRMCLGPQWAVLSTKKNNSQMYTVYALYTPRGNVSMFYVGRWW